MTCCWSSAGLATRLDEGVIDGLAAKLVAKGAIGGLAKGLVVALISGLLVGLSSGLDARLVGV